MTNVTPQFEVQLAGSDDDVLAAQRLRYAVFVKELGGTGPDVNHALQAEVDRFDAHADHLLLKDVTRAEGDQVVGVYRLMSAAHANAAGGFSAAQEYDIAPLQDSAKTLMELSRSCLHVDYRGGMAMFHLWQGLADEILKRQIDILFGVASLHGTAPDAHREALAMLFAEHASPYPVKSRQSYEMIDCHYDKVSALRQTPALIKAYLRLGGAVGQGAFVDRRFNTTDVCMILETAKMNARQQAIYTR